MRFFVSGSTKTFAKLISRYRNHLGFLLTPASGNSAKTIPGFGVPWGIDNGAFSGFEAVAFEKCVTRAAKAAGLQWVVCPDVVGDAARTLELWREWEPRLREWGVPPAFVLQDGQEGKELPDADCYFIGGSTEFKLSRVAFDLVQEGKRRGAWIHMGRVNSFQRLKIAHEWGCDSVDGTKTAMFGEAWIARYARYLEKLDAQLIFPARGR